jgi:dethiobiotin synthetase
MTTRLFVTGTGTGLGKTFVTAALAAAARARGQTVRAIKPVLSGFDPAELAGSDAGVLLQAQGLPEAALDRVSPWRFAAPLSPDMAAAREGRTVDVDAVIRFTRAAAAGPEQVVLVEGVGGVMVPLDATHTVLDWIQAANLPVLLVAGSYLGTISHTLTACAVLARAGAGLRAVIVSESAGSTVPLDETEAVIGRFAGAPVVTVPRRPGPAPWRDVPELADLLA